MATYHAPLRFEKLHIIRPYVNALLDSGMPLYFDLDGLERALWRGGAVPNRASDKQLLKKACREVWNTPYESDFVRRRAIDFMDLIDYDTDMRAQVSNILKGLHQVVL